jgi:hypothetical protein
MQFLETHSGLLLAVAEKAMTEGSCRPLQHLPKKAVVEVSQPACILHLGGHAGQRLRQLVADNGHLVWVGTYFINGPQEFPKRISVGCRPIFEFASLDDDPL